MKFAVTRLGLQAYALLAGYGWTSLKLIVEMF